MDEGDDAGDDEGDSRARDAAGVEGLPDPVDAPLPDDLDFEVKERAMDEAPVGIAISDSDLPDNPLVYVNDNFEAVTGYSRSEAVGRNCRFLQGPETDPDAVATLREHIDAEEPVTVVLRNYRRDGEMYWNEVTVAPLRNEDDEVTHFVGFQADVTRRKEAERALARERERLDGALDRTAGVLDAVTAAITGETSRQELEATICEALADREEYLAVRIDRLDPARDRLTFATGAPDDADGDATGPDPLADGADPTDGLDVDAEHPTAAAFRTGAVRIADRDADEWPAGEDAASMIAIPLVHRDDVQGVLTILAGDPSAFDERERTAFAAVGRFVGAATSVIESRRIVAADEVTEVEFELVDDDAVFVALSERLGTRVEYLGAVRSEERPTLFFAVDDADPDAVLSAARDHPAVADASVLSEAGERLRIGLRPTGDDLVGRLAEDGAETTSLVAEDGRAILTVTIPAEADVRTLFERLGDRHPGTKLRSTTTRDRRPQTSDELLAEARETLTDRQLTALRSAFVGGYFDKQRDVTGDELADMMGVSRSTFHQHLRAAERKVLASMFDR